MKALCLLLMLAALQVKQSYGQHLVIANTKENVVYVGLSNPLEFAIEGQKCKDFTLSADNGALQAGDDLCSYFITPEKPGLVTLSVMQKGTAKQFGKLRFKAKPIPTPIAIVAQKNGGKITSNELAFQMGISADIPNFDLNVHIIVTHFTVVILRKGKSIFVKDYDGALFPQSLKDVFASTEMKDRIVFTGISYKGPSSAGTLQPIEFTVIE